MKAKRLRQREFGFTDWGGKRRGAGRKPKGEKAGVSHAKRPKLAARFPVHVTVKLAQGLPSLRTPDGNTILRQAFAAGFARFADFRLVEYSIQRDHVHLIAESSDELALTTGMRGLTVRIARALNRLWGRKGRVFADRWSRAHPEDAARGAERARVPLPGRAQAPGVGHARA